MRIIHSFGQQLTQLLGRALTPPSARADIHATSCVGRQRSFEIVPLGVLPRLAVTVLGLALAVGDIITIVGFFKRPSADLSIVYHLLFWLFAVAHFALGCAWVTLGLAGERLTGSNGRRLGIATIASVAIITCMLAELSCVLR